MFTKLSHLYSSMPFMTWKSLQFNNNKKKKNIVYRCAILTLCAILTTQKIRQRPFFFFFLHVTYFSTNYEVIAFHVIKGVQKWAPWFPEQIMSLESGLDVTSSCSAVFVFNSLQHSSDEGVTAFYCPTITLHQGFISTRLQRTNTQNTWGRVFGQGYIDQMVY